MRPLAAQRTNQCSPSLKNPRTKTLRRGLKKDFDFKLVGQQLCGDNDLGDGCFSLYVMPASAWYFAVEDNEEVETYNQALVGCIVFRG